MQNGMISYTCSCQVRDRPTQRQTTPTRRPLIQIIRMGERGAFQRQGQGQTQDHSQGQGQRQTRTVVNPLITRQRNQQRSLANHGQQRGVRAQEIRVDGARATPVQNGRQVISSRTPPLFRMCQTPRTVRCFRWPVDRDRRDAYRYRRLFELT